MRYFVIILIAVFAAISSSQSSAGIIEKGAKAYIAEKVVRLISKNDNRGSGACIGAQCRGVRDGDRIEIIVDD